MLIGDGSINSREGSAIFFAEGTSDNFYREGIARFSDGESATIGREGVGTIAPNIIPANVGSANNTSHLDAADVIWTAGIAPFKVEIKMVVFIDIPRMEP